MASANPGSSRERLVASIIGQRPIITVEIAHSDGAQSQEDAEVFRFKKPLSREDAERLVGFMDKPVMNGMGSHLVWFYRKCALVLPLSGNMHRHGTIDKEEIDKYEVPLTPHFMFLVSFCQSCWVSGREKCLSCAEDKHPFQGKDTSKFYVNPHCKTCDGYGDLSIDQALWMVGKGIPGCTARIFKVKHKFDYEADQRKKSHASLVHQLPLK